MKTQQEVKDLKKEWLHDPCWDIEDTVGFEDHYDDLKTFSNKIKAQSKIDRQAYIKNRAEEMGIPSNTVLAEYIIYLEERIEKLESFVAI